MNQRDIERLARQRSEALNSQRENDVLYGCSVCGRILIRDDNPTARRIDFPDGTFVFVCSYACFEKATQQRLLEKE